MKNIIITILVLALSLACNRRMSPEYEETGSVTSVSHQPGYNTVNTSVDGEGHVSITTSWVDDTWSAYLHTQQGIDTSVSGGLARKIYENYPVGQSLFIKYRKVYSVDKSEDGKEKLSCVGYDVEDVATQSFEMPREDNGNP